MKVVRKNESYICTNNTFCSTTIILSIFCINIVLQHEQDLNTINPSKLYAGY